MHTTRRHFLGAAGAALALLSAAPVRAHHGWRWADDGEFEISGIVKEARLGNPHGVLVLDVEGELWTIEVGQPWRNERAGLKDGMLTPGTDLMIRGHRSKESTEKRVKAERVIIGGNTYDLYPERK